MTGFAVLHPLTEIKNYREAIKILSVADLTLSPIRIPWNMDHLTDASKNANDYCSLFRTTQRTSLFEVNNLIFDYLTPRHPSGDGKIPSNLGPTICSQQLSPCNDRSNVIRSNKKRTPPWLQWLEKLFFSDRHNCTLGVRV